MCTMLIEIRTYVTRPGQRDNFIQFLQDESFPAQRNSGMLMRGPFVDLKTASNTVCLRGFQNLQERDRIRGAFYESTEWNKSLKPIVTPMLSSYSVVLIDAPAHALSF
jgi:hypothetical protein